MKALITGIGGQDGRLLSSHLVDLGYEVYGVSSPKRRTDRPENVFHVDLADFKATTDLIRAVSPDEIYHLSALHHSSEYNVNSYFSLVTESLRANVLSTLNLLEACSSFVPSVRLFFASSAQIFGDCSVSPQNEFTPRNPLSLYASTKLMSMNICSYYRSNRNLFVSTGILYNHESSLRDSGYVSKKIVAGLVRILNHETKELRLGDLDAQVDWGYAGDYVEAMQKMIRLDNPDDFVVATGQTHTVREFLELASKYVGVDWQEYVTVDGSILQRRPTGILVGDSSKLRNLTGWVPKTSFEAMVRAMVEHEVRLRSAEEKSSLKSNESTN